MNKAIAGASLAALLAVAAMAPVSAQTRARGVRVVPPSSRVARVATQPVQQFVALVNNEQVPLANEPLRSGANILVPLRESLEAVGAQDVHYDPAMNRIAFTYNGQQGFVDVASNQASLGGNPLRLPAPLLNVDGMYYVRSEFIQQLEPTFQVTRVAVAGYRGGVAVPPPAAVTQFTYGGNTYNFNAPTYYEGGVLMVPLTDTLNSLGINDNYQAGDLQIRFPYNGENVLLNVTSGYAYVGQQQFILDRPVAVYQDQVYVPASFIARLVPGFGVTGQMRLTPETTTTGLTTEETMPATTGVMGGK